MPKPRSDNKTDWKTTVRLERGIHRALKAVSGLQGVSVQDFVRIAVEERMKKLGLEGLLQLAEKMEHPKDKEGT